MSAKGGAFRLGAAIRSLLTRRQATRSPAPKPEEPRARQKRLWALVQTKPVALVLLVSDCRENLEAEARELHATWNHRELRRERHTYEIQPVALLQTARDPVVRAAGQQGKNGQQRVG